MEKNRQKEELARRLAEKEEENKIIARAYYLNFNAPRAGYYNINTRIASK
jgi:hypothetical protein